MILVLGLLQRSAMFLNRNTGVEVLTCNLLTMSGLCRDYVGILSDRTSVLRRDYVGGYVGLYGGYAGSQGKPR